MKTIMKKPLVFSALFSLVCVASTPEECHERLVSPHRLLSVDEVQQLQGSLQNSQSIRDEIKTALGAESFHFSEGAVRGITGDFLHVVTTSQGVLILIGDGNGHGIQAANDSIRLQSLLEGDRDQDGIPDAIQNQGSPPTPDASLSSLNAQAAEYLAKRSTNDAGLIAMQAVSIDRKGNVVIANSGMPNVHIVRKNGIVERFIPEGPMLGMLDAQMFSAVRGESLTCTLASGDRLVLMSDGITDRDEHTLDMVPFLTAAAHGSSSSESFAKAFLGSLPKYTHDDATLLVIEQPSR